MLERRRRSVLFRLFFTRDDDLDLLQLLFVLRVVSDLLIVVSVGSGMMSLPAAAWWFMGITFLTLAIAGTPTWVARLIANSKAVAEAAGAFPSGERLFGPSTEGMDEEMGRGDDG